jgi:hypothetical protein
MNRFQPRVRPGRKFPATRKLLRQSNLGLFAALAPRWPPPLFAGGSGALPAAFARRGGSFAVVLCETPPETLLMAWCLLS